MKYYMESQDEVDGIVNSTDEAEIEDTGLMTDEDVDDDLDDDDEIEPSDVKETDKSER